MILAGTRTGVFTGSIRCKYLVCMFMYVKNICLIERDILKFLFECDIINNWRRFSE